MSKQVPAFLRHLGMALLMSVATVPARADGPGWTANSTVTKLVVTADGGVNVLLSPAPNGCVSQSGYGPHFASIYPDHPGINRIKADHSTPVGSTSVKSRMPQGRSSNSPIATPNCSGCVDR